MRTPEHRLRFALALVGALLAGQSLACEPPAGFVNPPRPEIGPLEDLLAHTEQTVIAREFSDLMKIPSRPLEETMRPMKDMPGVSGTFRLSNGPYGSVGARRLVCLTDGSISVEEVLLTESHSNSRRFRYVVWNYTREKMRDVDYAVGEFVHTKIAPGKTQVNWTYRFALKEGRDRELFRSSFLERDFAEWMRTLQEQGRSRAEAYPLSP
jgi:hypothetical protein